MDSDRFGDAVQALGHRYRRQLMMGLLEHNPQDVEDVRDANEGREDYSDIEIEMVHNHLPLLEELGFINWDRESGDVSTGRKWDEIKPLLELLDDHAEELPNGWL